MKSVLSFFITVLFLLPFDIFGQKYTAVPVDKASVKSLSSAFTNYHLFQLNTADISGYVRSRGKNKFDLDIFFPALSNFSFTLFSDNILHPSYKLVAAGRNENILLPGSSGITYGGNLKGEEAMSRLTITGDLIYGIIKKSNSEFFIEPLRYFDKSAPVDIYVLYASSDVIPDASLKCGLTEMSERKNIIEGSRAATGCVITEIAIAADESMYTKYGSISAVETHNIGVMNNVQGDYLNGQFEKEIHFTIVTQNISTSASSDQLSPSYTGTNSSTILSNFRTWGQAGNFGVTYDVAQLWTNRNIDSDGAGTNSSIVGLAYVGVICGTSRYHLLQDYAGTLPTGTGYSLRVLTSHELGHNFSANHDDAGSGFIMAPSINNTVTWSPASISSINAHVSTRTCLQQCIPQGDCLPVTGLTYSAITNNSATVSWAAVSGNTSYDVEYKASSSTTWLMAATGISGTSVNLTGLVQGTLYDWRVKPYCSTGMGTYSQSSVATSSTVISCEQCSQVP